MPSLSDNQQGEMARRSTRLVKSRFYPPDDDTASTSSTGSTGQISYRESPFRVFKRKPGNHRAGSASHSTIASSESQELNISEILKAEGLTVRRNPVFQTLSTTSSKTVTLVEPSGFSSGYSSSEEGYCTDCHTNSLPTSSSKSPTERLRLRDMLTTSPARAFGVLYFWLGMAWYSLTSGTSLLNVSLLSRFTTHLKKIILLILLLFLLVFGLWYWFPSLVALLSRCSTTSPIQTKQPPVFTTLGDRDLYASFSDLKDEIYGHLEEHERKLKDQRRQMEDVLSKITLLKQDGEKQTSEHENLKKDTKDLRINMRNVESEQRTLLQGLSDVNSQTSVLRSDVSQLHLSSEQLGLRISAQESQNAKLKAELSEQLLQQLAGPLDTQSDVVMRPDMQRALEDLEKKIMDRLGRERSEERRDVWRSVGETLTQEGVGAITVKDIERIVWRALCLHRAGGIGMADYALESSGASVINTRCSETYHTKSACISLFGFPLWYPSESPRTVIQYVFVCLCLA
ncbi:SUN domain-containing protein 2 isoform X2 [Trichomycterus rosablanca]|uniref:SUN domain-containing protein 2 isoform X2 n=1 Tax=Trichomycterus rosablanca TaxID=2290929 RepID=UPI002F360063